jgi:hypothetical protein
LEVAQEVVTEETARQEGLSYPTAAGVLASVLDTRRRVLGKLGRSM